MRLTHRTHRRGTALAAAAASVALLVGSMPVLGAATAPAATRIATADQAATGTLTVAGPVPIVDLDVHGPNAVEDPTTIAANHIFDTVVKHEGDGYVPALATEWSATDDLTWSFTIRSDATFSDGSPVTAGDIKASIERVVALEGPLAPLWSSLASVEAPDDTTLVITTATPFGGMLTNLSLLYVTPASLTGEDGFFLAPIGSGPFTVASFEPGERLTLAARPDHWGGAPSIDELVFREIPEVSSRVTALTTGEIDFTWGLPPDQVPQLEGQDGITVTTAPSLAHYFQWFNSSRPPFDDPKVRQAMWHAVDLQVIVDALFPGMGALAQAPIQPPVFGFAANTPYAYDPELARQLLTEAGYPDGFTTSMQWSATCCVNIRELAQVLIDQWSDIGVTVEPQEKEQAQWVEDLLALNWDMNVGYNVTLTGDANFTIGRLYTCAANRTGYCSEELDGLIAQAQATIDDAERAALWAQAGTLIWEQALGITIMDVNQNYAYGSRVSGFTPNDTGNPVFTTVTLAG
jgi:peptide/nickel transport system substrate-binding protein